MTKEQARKVKYAINAALFLVVAYFVHRHGKAKQELRRQQWSHVEPSAKEPPVAALGSLLSSEGGTAPSAASPGRLKGDVLRKLSGTALSPKVETALGAAGGGKTATDLSLYLRMRRNKAEFSAAELSAIENSVVPALQQNPEEAMALVGRTLAALDADVENRPSRMDLFHLAATVSPRENVDVSQSALANLSEIYAPDSGLGAEERFDLAVTTLQAYLATTAANAAGANAAIDHATRGALDPAVKEALRSMIADRYP